MAGATLAQVLLLALASHLVGAWAATVFDFWNGHYFVWGAAFAFFLGVILLVPLVAIALSRISEIAAILFGRGPRRLLTAPAKAPEGYAPKVSIHIPAYMESPEMLIATIDSVSRLNYPNFECVVIINNTPDPAYWQPIEEHCTKLGEHFKFINAPKVDGFKAGALRLAMEKTAPDAEIIGIIDADYVVHPNWLADLVPLFADSKVGLVQAPQDHRDGRRSPLHHIMNGEYAGFFDIGMVERNETNAIIVHGTMCLIRRAAMDQAGGWSSDTICEDTDLGLSILENGWVAHYTNQRYGHGLLPDTFEAYKKQRHRWAYGGVQIAKKHWRRMLPGATRLTSDQRKEFSTGWLNWLGAESIGVVVAILNLIWVPIVAFVGIAIPDKILTLPILAAFAVSLLHFVALYRARVAIPPGQALAAMFAAMSMQWTVARAVGFGLIKDHLPFVRTAKGGIGAQAAIVPCFQRGAARRPAGSRRDRGVRHQLRAGARDQPVRLRAASSEPAVPGRCDARRVRAHPLQQLRVLVRSRTGTRDAAACADRRSSAWQRRCGRSPASPRRQWRMHRSHIRNSASIRRSRSRRSKIIVSETCESIAENSRGAFYFAAIAVSTSRTQYDVPTESRHH